MEKSKQKFRYILQYYFDQGTNAAQACKKINEVYGEFSLTEAAAQKWFARFRCGNFDVEDAPRSGRPSIERVDDILEKIKQDPHTTTAEIAKELKVNQKTVWNHLVKAGFEKKLDVWVSRDSTQKDLIKQNRISFCESLLRRNEVDPFLKRMVTGDIRWIVCENNVRKRSWSQSSDIPSNKASNKPTAERFKFMLSFWWDCEGVIYWEVLPAEQTLDPELYCQQLNSLKRAIEEKRPHLLNHNKLAFYHDDSRPYATLTTRQKLKDFKWEALVYPQSSPDLSPSNYHLFKSLQNSMNLSEFTEESCRAHLANFFSLKSQQFYTEGITSLPEKWRRVFDSNGDYLV